MQPPKLPTGEFGYDFCGGDETAKSSARELMAKICHEILEHQDTLEVEIKEFASDGWSGAVHYHIALKTFNPCT